MIIPYFVDVYVFLSLLAIIDVDNYCYCPILYQYVLIITPLH